MYIINSVMAGVSVEYYVIAGIRVSPYHIADFYVIGLL